MFSWCSEPTRTDKVTGEPLAYGVDVVKAAATFDIYGIEDKREGLRMMAAICHYMVEEPLSDGEVLYGEIADDELPIVDE